MRSKVFISYSHKDKKWLVRLLDMLKPLVRQGLEVWDDTKIQPGDVWKQEIEKALKSAKVAILLVSPHFLASDFIDKEELPPLLEAAQKDGLRIFWVLINDCLWDKTPIKNYQATNDVENPLALRHHAYVNDDLANICRKIDEALQDPPPAR